ncbi:MAG: acyltransferase [Caldilineaceae bacterium]|nr:acyltransferase [Caldilineaceae bacterium]
MKPSTHKQIRRLVEQAARLLTTPVWLAYQAQAKVLGRDFACIAVSQRAASWTGPLGIYLRRALYKQILAAMGEDVAIGMGTILTKPTIRFGNGVYLGSYCIIGDTYIGDNTLISDQVSIISGNHSMDPDRLIKDQPEVYRTILIGEDCWVGNRAVVMAHLGNHCVVGAGSVVTKPVDDYMIVAGNPARPIGDRRHKRTTTGERERAKMQAHHRRPEIYHEVQVP